MPENDRDTTPAPEPRPVIELPASWWTEPTPIDRTRLPTERRRRGRL
jgi:hypothetical protein